MRIVLPALLLAACSGNASDNTAVPEPAASSTVAASPLPEATSAPSTAAAKPGELKTFGDWTVGCDNTALCTLASLGPDHGQFPEVTMAVLRQPGPKGAIDLSFEVAQDGEAVAPVAVAIDGKRIALRALGGPAAVQVAAAMANGATLAILESGDRERARLSLKGASAALRWIDAQQGRVGTVTAVVAKGAKPAAAVPERRAAPVIQAVIPTETAASPTAAQFAAMRRQVTCEDGRSAGGSALEPEAHALGGGATLVMLPCSVGAYNLSSTLFVIRDGTVEPARADVSTGMGPVGDGLTSVVNGEWNNGELSSFAKGRGLGDCGVRQTFVWDGERLRLSEQSEMGECRGNPNYITTWRAQVVRR